uniref:Uncharacterized protein n=1 Tax=Setaria digitata TaxID=48799 RepID=A0A915PXG6_9BILA
MGKSKGKEVGTIPSTTTIGSNKEKLEDPISMNKNGEIILRIHAKPNAKATRVIARDGQANEVLINAMMDILELHKSEIIFDTVEYIYTLSSGIEVTIVVKKVEQGVIDDQKL